MITNRVLSTKEIVLVVHATLVKPNLMRKLDPMNIIIQIKVQNHRNTFEATSNAPKSAKTRKNFRSIIITLLKSDLNGKKDFERLVLFRNGVT